MSDNGNELNFLSLLQEFKVVGEFAKFANRLWAWGLDRKPSRSCAILLIPGFMAGDATLYPFGNWIRSRGHRVYFSGIMANADCPRNAMERLSRILQELHARYDEKLVIIGHSLGGIYARELSRNHPDLIEQTILLGAPVHEPHRRSNPFVKMLAHLTVHIHESARGCSGDLATICGVHQERPPHSVPETIIFSKSDGVVDWRSCLETGPNIRAYEVQSTHVGLPYNLETLRIVNRILETPPEEVASSSQAAI